MLSKLGRYEDALATIEDALRLKIDDGEVWNNKRAVLSMLGRMEEADHAFKKAQELGFER